MRYVSKITKMGGRVNPSYGITIPKELIKKYGYDTENYVWVEDDEFKRELKIKKIPYA